MDSQGKTPRLLDQVRQVMRLHHYSLHTERAYVDWIKRYVRFHQMQRREDLAGGEAKIEAFLTDLAERSASERSSAASREAVCIFGGAVRSFGGAICGVGQRSGESAKTLAYPATIEPAKPTDMKEIDFPDWPERLVQAPRCA